MGLLHEALPVSTLVVAIDPGKVSNRVWLSSGEAGPIVPPLSLPVLRPGLDRPHRLIVDHPGPSAPVLAIEATGALHQAWVRELNQRFPGSVRLFAPSETAAARAQPGSRAHGRVLTSEAAFWIDRWRACLPPRVDAAASAARLARRLARWRALTADIVAVDDRDRCPAGRQRPGRATCRGLRRRGRGLTSDAGARPEAQPDTPHLRCGSELFAGDPPLTCGGSTAQFLELDELTRALQLDCFEGCDEGPQHGSRQGRWCEVERDHGGDTSSCCAQRARGRHAAPHRERGVLSSATGARGPMGTLSRTGHAATTSRLSCGTGRPW
jgi:hypothetical protein